MSSGFLSADILNGVNVLEFSSIGPVPWATLLLSQLGANVTRIVRPGGLSATGDRLTMADIGRESLEIDLKTREGQLRVEGLLKTHDVLVEGMRPGVLERLNLGPDTCLRINPSMVVVRVTGWGQTGPLAERAGHDINYIALSGALHCIGEKDGPPMLPLNLLGDFAGGGAFMLVGVIGGLLKAKMTGCGSVVDVSMLDGVTQLMGMIYERYGLGQWTDQRGSNRLDGGVPWYSVYKTKCGGYMAVGANESKFYKLFVETLGFKYDDLPDRDNDSSWPFLRAQFSQAFLSRTRLEWSAIFDSIDACVSPVLSLREAPNHPHNVARQLFVNDNGVQRPNTAPRFR